MNINLVRLSNSLDVNGRSVAANMVRVKVALKPNDMFDSIAEAYFHEIMRVTRFEAKQTVISLDNVQKFFDTILYLHVRNCNQTLPQEYRGIMKRVNLPTVLVAILSNIGEVTDSDFGLRFYPEYEIESEKLMSVSEIEDFSQELYRLEKLGIKITTTGLPMPNDCGTLGFMGCQLVDNKEVLSYRHDHPVYGFFQAMFKSNALSEIIGNNALRVRYGYYDHYSSLVRVFVNESERN